MDFHKIRVANRAVFDQTPSIRVARKGHPDSYQFGNIKRFGNQEAVESGLATSSTDLTLQTSVRTVK